MKNSKLNFARIYPHKEGRSARVIEFLSVPYYEGKNIWEVRESIIRDGLTPATFDQVYWIVEGLRYDQFGLDNDTKGQRSKLKKLVAPAHPNKGLPNSFWGFSAVNHVEGYPDGDDYVLGFDLYHDLRDGKLRGEIEECTGKEIVKKYINGKFGHSSTEELSTPGGLYLRSPPNPAIPIFSTIKENKVLWKPAKGRWEHPPFGVLTYVHTPAEYHTPVSKHIEFMPFDGTCPGRYTFGINKVGF